MLNTTIAKPVETSRIAPVNALPAGTRLQEFEVQAVIGEGGFGIVYRAFDTLLERDVAIKEYLPVSHASRRSDGTVVASSERQRDSFDRGLRCFVSEARMLARFKHRALVEILRFWEEKGTAYMVMPYYEGRPLSQLVQHGFRIQDTAAMLAFLNPLLDGLAMLHAVDCYHRDISTDNILILEDGSPLLLDFGAARRILVDESEVMTIILKPGFAPIEQYSDDHVMAPQGPWTDLYALAAVAYQLVTGTMPMVSVGRIIRDPLVPLAASAPAGLSPGVVAAIDAGLRVRPDQRPQSVDAFLKIMASDVSVSAPPRVHSDPVPADDLLTMFGATAIDESSLLDIDPQIDGVQRDSPGSRRSGSERPLVSTIKDEARAAGRNPDARPPAPRRSFALIAAVLSVLLLVGLGSYVLMGDESDGDVQADASTLAGQHSPNLQPPRVDPARVEVMAVNVEAPATGEAVGPLDFELGSTQVGVHEPEPASMQMAADVEASPIAGRADDTKAPVASTAVDASTVVAEVIFDVPAIEPDTGIEANAPLSPDAPGADSHSEATPARTVALADSAPTSPVASVEVKVGTETAPAADASRPAVVDIRVAPWGNVFVNGELVGVAPPRVRFEAATGPLEVEIRNETHVPKHISIDVEAGRTYRIRHGFGKD